MVEEYYQAISDLEGLNIIKEYERAKSTQFGLLLKIYNKFISIFPEFPLKLSSKDERLYERIIYELDLDLTPKKIVSATLVFVLFGILIMPIVILSTSASLFLLYILFYILGIYFLTFYPKHVYFKLRRLKEAQIGLAVFYVVSYMRLNPNLEAAIKFATRYLPFPLKLDFLRILWLVETKRETSIIEALDKYLIGWMDDAYYFVEAMELIVSVLYESNPFRKDLLLDRALEVVIDGVQLKMQKYVRELKGPIEATYMLGLVLPLLTITLLPIISAFMTEMISPSLLITLYDVALPTIAFFVGFNVLEKRPGFSIYEDDIIYIELKRNMLKNLSISILAAGLTFFVTFLLVSVFFIPAIYEYNILALLLSLFLVMMFGLSLAVAALEYYKGVREIKERVVCITNDLPYVLYHLANRIGEGRSVEYAFLKVYMAFKNKELGKFAYLVYRNTTFGYPLDEAILNPKIGAIRYYPSSLLKSSMQILLESSRRGPDIAARTMLYLSQYLSKLKNVEEKLKDLLADVTSSMKVLVTLMAPVMIGLIVGLSVMMTGVLYGFSSIYKSIQSVFSEDITTMGIPLGLLEMFSIKNVVPPFVLQFMVGIYLIEITIILAFFLNRIENGYDSIEEKKYIGEYLLRGTVLYVLVCGLSSILLWQLALSIFQIFAY